MNSVFSINDFIPLTTFFLISVLTPGPNNIMVMSAASTSGFRQCLPHILGIIFGHCLQVILLIIGLGTVFISYPIVKTSLAVFSSLFLVWFIYKLLQQAIKSFNKKDDLHANPKIVKPLSFFAAALFQWINPKAWFIGITVSSGLIPKNVPFFYSLIITALIILMCTTFSISLWGLLGSTIRRYLLNSWIAFIFYATMALALLATIYYIIISTIKV